MMISTKLNPPLSSDLLLCVSPGCVATKLDSETIILNIDAGIYYGVSDVGAFVWELLQQPATLTTIEQAVLSEYEVDAQTCEADLQELVQELIDQRLIFAQLIKS
jgi:hypothetical protein